MFFNVLAPFYANPVASLTTLLSDSLCSDDTVGLSALDAPTLHRIAIVVVDRLHVARNDMHRLSMLECLASSMASLPHFQASLQSFDRYIVRMHGDSVSRQCVLPGVVGAAVTATTWFADASLEHRGALLAIELARRAERAEEG
eukprot:5859523-Amphidinium_carterae.3